MGHKPKCKRGKKKRRKRKGRVASCVRSVLCCFSGTNISDVSDEEGGEEIGRIQELGQGQENVRETESMVTGASRRGAKSFEEKEDINLAVGDREDLKTKQEQDTKNTLDENVMLDKSSDASEVKGESVDENFGEVKDELKDTDSNEIRKTEKDDDAYEDLDIDEKTMHRTEEETETDELDEINGDAPELQKEVKGESIYEDLGKVSDERKRRDSDEVAEMETDGPNGYVETNEESMHGAEKETENYEAGVIRRGESKIKADERMEDREGKKMKIDDMDTEIALINSIRDLHKRNFIHIFQTGSKFMSAIARQCSSLGLVTLKVHLPRNLQLRRMTVFYTRPCTSKSQTKYCTDDMYLPQTSAFDFVMQKSSIKETPVHHRAPHNLQRPLVTFIPESQVYQRPLVTFIQESQVYQRPLVTFIPESQVYQQFFEIMVVVFDLFSRTHQLSEMQGFHCIEEIGKNMVEEIESKMSAARTDSRDCTNRWTDIDGNDTGTDNALVSCGKADNRTLNRQIFASMFLTGFVRNNQIIAAVAVHCARLGLILLRVHLSHAFQLRRALASNLRGAHDFHFPRASVRYNAVQQMQTQQLLAYSDSRSSVTHQSIYTTVSFSLENQAEVDWLTCQQFVKKIPGSRYFVETKFCLESQEKTQLGVKPMQMPRELQNAECNKTQSFIEANSIHQEHPRITCTDIVFAHLKKESPDASLNRRIFAILRLSAFKLRGSIFTAISMHSSNLGLIVLQCPYSRTEVVVTTKPAMKRMKATHLQTSVQVEQAKSYSVQIGEYQNQFSEEKQKRLNLPEGKSCSVLEVKHTNAKEVKHSNANNKPNRKNNASLKTRGIPNAQYEAVEGDISSDQTSSEHNSKNVTKMTEAHRLSHPELNVPYGVQMTRPQLVNCIQDRTAPGEVAAALVLHFLSTKSTMKANLNAAVQDLVGQKPRKADDETQNKSLTKPEGTGMDGGAACVQPGDLSTETTKPDTDVSSDTTECERETAAQNEYEEKSVGSKRRRKRRKKRKHYGYN